MCIRSCLAILAIICFLGIIVWNKPTLLEKIVVVERPLSQADTLVLMAGSLRTRASTIVDLYHSEIAPRILLTNDGILGAWSQREQRNLYQVEWTKEFLVERGIPEAVSYTHLTLPTN